MPFISPNLNRYNLDGYWVFFLSSYYSKSFIELLPKSFLDLEIVKQVLKRMLGNSEPHPFADQFDKLYFLTSSKPFLHYISALRN